MPATLDVIGCLSFPHNYMIGGLAAGCKLGTTNHYERCSQASKAHKILRHRLTATTAAVITNPQRVYTSENEGCGTCYSCRQPSALCKSGRKNRIKIKKIKCSIASSTGSLSPLLPLRQLVLLLAKYKQILTKRYIANDA